MNTQPAPQGRRDAFARMQQLVLDRVYAIHLGVAAKVRANRSNVLGFEPFGIPRLSNVWIAP